MAKKRVIEVPLPPPAEPEEDKGPGWKEWLTHDYARYWYWIGAAFLDIVILFESQRALGVDWKVALFLALLAAVAEAYIYLKLWGEGGRFGEEP